MLAEASWNFNTVVQVDAQARAHVAYYHFQQGALHYATCSRACELDGSWRIVEADDAGDVGRSPSLSLTGDSRLGIVYLDYTTGDPYPLKVLE